MTEKNGNRLEQEADTFQKATSLVSCTGGRVRFENE